MSFHERCRWWLLSATDNISQSDRIRQSFHIEIFQERICTLHHENGKVHYADVGVIPLNAKKCMSLCIGNLLFVDSFQFMAALLDELCKGMRKEGVDDFVHTTHYFGHDEIYYQKGIYPYDYVNGPLRLNETALPPKRHSTTVSRTSTSTTSSMHAHVKCGSTCWWRRYVTTLATTWSSTFWFRPTCSENFVTPCTTPMVWTICIFPAYPVSRCRLRWKLPPSSWNWSRTAKSIWWSNRASAEVWATWHTDTPGLTFRRWEQSNIAPTCRRHTSSIWTAICSMPRVSSFRFRSVIFVYFRTTSWHDSTWSPSPLTRQLHRGMWSGIFDAPALPSHAYPLAPEHLCINKDIWVTRTNSCSMRPNADT